MALLYRFCGFAKPPFRAYRDFSDSFLEDEFSEVRFCFIGDVAPNWTLCPLLVILQLFEKPLEQEPVYLKNLDPAASVLDKEVRLAGCSASVSQLQLANVVQVHTQLLGLADGRLVFLISRVHISAQRVAFSEIQAEPIGALRVAG